MRQRGGGGMMVWALTKQGTPSAEQLAQAACRTLGMGGCTAPLGLA